MRTCVGAIRIALRSRNIVQDRLEERLHVALLVGKVKYGHACFGRGIDERAFQLLIGSTEIDEKFQYFINTSSGRGFRTVDLIDTYDDGKT